MKETKQELKRCPFCGETKNISTFVDADESERILFANFAHNHPYKKEWQNAYCWKEIDSNNKKIEALIRAAKDALKMTAELSRNMDDDHWYRGDLRRLAEILETTIAEAQ